MKHEAAPELTGDSYLTVREVAAYLHLNEKKIYALVKDGAIPATKAAGKWLFPRRLVDEWLMESTHGGVLTDRLIVTGSDDPLLATAVALLAAEVGHTALISICPTGTRMGLELLSRRRANLCAIHWGQDTLADRLHTQIVRQYPGHTSWALVRMARREQGVMVRPDLMGTGVTLDELIGGKQRWAFRQEGSGSQHFFQTALFNQQVTLDGKAVVATALSERHAASLIVQGQADCAPGVRSAASEFGLKFLPLGWECFDLVLPQGVYFRNLFQQLLAVLGGQTLRDIAASLHGYDLELLGRVISIPSD